MERSSLRLRREVLVPLDADELQAVQGAADYAPTRDGICTITGRSVCYCDA